MAGIDDYLKRITLAVANASAPVAVATRPARCWWLGRGPYSGGYSSPIVIDPVCVHTGCLIRMNFRRLDRLQDTNNGSIREKVRPHEGRRPCPRRRSALHRQRLGRLTANFSPAGRQQGPGEAHEPRLVWRKDLRQTSKMLPHLCRIVI